MLSAVADDMGWTGQLAQGAVLGQWAQIVGADNAERTEPLGIDDGVLLVRCTSTAWAQQMRLLRAEITSRLIAEYPDAGIATIRFLGPDGPSFQRGRRSVSGRGPRDTWG